MGIYFKNDNHEKLYNEFNIKSKKTSSIIYILTSVVEDMDELNELYETGDLKHGGDGYIILDNLSLFKDKSSSDKMLIALAFNLYNNIDITNILNIDNKITPYTVYCAVSFGVKNGLEVYSNALKLML